MKPEKTPATGQQALDAASLSEPTLPLLPRAPRTSLGERLLLVGLGIGLLVFAVDYILGGAQGAGTAWFQGRQAVLDFLTWRIDFYVLATAPLLAAGAYAMRHALPIIEMPLGDGGGFKKAWYWPGTYHEDGDVAMWREGHCQAITHRALIHRKGLFGHGIVGAVQRTVDHDRHLVTYAPVAIEPYVSQTLARRMQRQIQEQVMQAQKDRVRDEKR